MDAESVLEGRPHGGVDWICIKINNVSYRGIDIDNDKLSGVQVVTRGKIKMNIIGVYLPYHNGSVDQIELYGETLECLQSIIDLYQGQPLVIIGYYNAALPQKQSLRYNWSKQQPCNAHSMLLYDFICDNELYVARFVYKQPVNYIDTKCIHSTHLDHVLIPQEYTHMILDCKIIDTYVDSTSDHLPIRTSLTINLQDLPNTTTCNKDNVIIILWQLPVNYLLLI